MERAYPSDPGDTLVFANDRVRVRSMTVEPGGMVDFHQHHHDHLVLWPDRGQAVAQNLGDADWPISLAAEPGFALFQTVGTAEPRTPHRIRNVGDVAVTHDVVELVGERSPSEQHLPRETNDLGTFTVAASREPA